MTTPTGHAGPGSWVADPAWEQALDRLQDDLVAVERSHFAGEPFTAQPWTPPALPRPLPAYLGERARALAARQAALLTLIAEQRDRARRQLEVTRRINHSTGAASRPPTVFFDASV